MLRASSAAHPRLHALWPTLLALLLPGYSIARVRGEIDPAKTLEHKCCCWSELACNFRMCDRKPCCKFRAPLCFHTRASQACVEPGKSMEDNSASLLFSFAT